MIEPATAKISTDRNVGHDATVARRRDRRQLLATPLALGSRATTPG